MPAFSFVRVEQPSSPASTLLDRESAISAGLLVFLRYLSDGRFASSPGLKEMDTSNWIKEVIQDPKRYKPTTSTKETLRTSLMPT